MNVKFAMNALAPGIYKMLFSKNRKFSTRCKQNQLLFVFVELTNQGF